jgi:hypothetical protein
VALRIGCGIFAVYLAVMAAALVWPSVFDAVMGVVGVAWPRPASHTDMLLANMALCGGVPAAFLAAHTALVGAWDATVRGYFLVFLFTNLAANALSIARDSAFLGILAGDFAVVGAMLVLVVVVRPQRA